VYFVNKFWFLQTDLFFSHQSQVIKYANLELGGFLNLPFISSLSSFFYFLFPFPLLPSLSALFTSQVDRLKYVTVSIATPVF